MIGHLPECLWLCVTTNLRRAKPFKWKCFSPTGLFSCKSNSHFISEGFSRGLVKKQRHKITRKWHITMIVIHTQSCCTYRLIDLVREKSFPCYPSLSFLFFFFPCVQTRFTFIHCLIRNDNTVSMCRNTVLHSGIKSSGETLCVLLSTILIFPDPRPVSLVVVTKFVTQRFSTQILCIDLSTVPEVQAGKI